MNNNLLTMIEYPNEGIFSKTIVNDKKNDVTLFCMAKGSSMSEHTSTKTGFVYVLEGKGIFNLKGKKIKMIPGVFIFMKKDDRHSLSAELNTSFLLSLR